MSLVQTGFLPVGEDEEGHSVRPRDRRGQKKVRGEVTAESLLNKSLE